MRNGGVIPVELVNRVHMPTLVIAGSESDEFFRETAERLAALLPDSRYRLLEGADHGAPPDLVAPVVTAFLTS